MFLFKCQSGDVLFCLLLLELNKQMIIDGHRGLAPKRAVFVAGECYTSTRHAARGEKWEVSSFFFFGSVLFGRRL